MAYLFLNTLLINFMVIDMIELVSGQNATGQNATMSKTDKMPQCKWCNKDTAEVYKDVTKVLQGCSMV